MLGVHFSQPNISGNACFKPTFNAAKSALYFVPGFAYYFIKFLLVIA